MCPFCSLCVRKAVMVTLNCFKCASMDVSALFNQRLPFWMLLISPLHSVVCCVDDLISQCNFSNCMVQLVLVLYCICLNPRSSPHLVKTIQLNIHSASMISWSHSPATFFLPNHTVWLLCVQVGRQGEKMRSSMDMKESIHEANSQLRQKLDALQK